ncbi:MAG: class I SAM-dependent methyltransferase [Halapricum sp.]
MRRFSADYLEATREGMWVDSRAALSPLELDTHERVLDVGCGTGELTSVLRAETDGEVVGLDADRDLLEHADQPVVQGDALTLPFRDDAFDLVVCQALLINLPDPAAAVREFARVASDLVAAVEPDNSAVSVTSTVDPEERLARRARRLYLRGVETDVALGADAADAFETVGLTDVSTRRYDHERTVDPPYTETDVEAARRKASGEGIETDRETLLAGDATPEDVDRLRQAWRSMGRDVIEQMQEDDYHRRETVPFFVTVGRV